MELQQILLYRIGPLACKNMHSYPWQISWQSSHCTKKQFILNIITNLQMELQQTQTRSTCLQQDAHAV